MIAITSISPSHINAGIQQQAIDSWNKLGMKCFSFNNKKECELLSKLYKGVTFVETTRTMEATYGKPYVSINAMMDWAKEQDENNFCFINSDIELQYDKGLLDRIERKMHNSLVVANRNDYKENKESSRTYLEGIDVFFINKEHLNLYPQAMYCMGQCFWDYWIPYTALRSGIEVYILKNKFAMHLAHNAQYSNDNWLKTGRYFLWENNLYQFSDTNGIGKMSQYVYNMIYGLMKNEII